MKRGFTWAGGAGVRAAGSSHGHSDDWLSKRGEGAGAVKGWAGQGKTSRWAQELQGSREPHVVPGERSKYKQVPSRGTKVNGVWASAPTLSLEQARYTSLSKAPKGHLKTVPSVLDLFSQKLSSQSQTHPCSVEGHSGTCGVSCGTRPLSKPKF